MPFCPTCATRLGTVRQREGLFHVCDRCSGRAATLPQIRRYAGDRFATHLLRQMNRSVAVTGRPCPFCSGKMRQVDCEHPPLRLEACRSCNVVWFEGSAFAAVPQGGSVSEDELEAMAHEILEEDKARRRAEAVAENPWPDAGWKALPAALGLPVELQQQQLARRPWATWILTALVVMVSVMAFPDIRRLADQWGFMPQHPWRHFGLTFLSCFFLHGNWFHLLGNMYFLVLFGNRVEDFLGPRRFLLLLGLATIGGDLLHLAIQPDLAVPGIGASGGIFGLVAFYALAFPRARLGMLVWYRWVAMPAWVALILWGLFQVMGAALQLMGVSRVNSFAHLGGAAAGIVAWVFWRKPAAPAAIAGESVPAPGRGGSERR